MFLSPFSKRVPRLWFSVKSKETLGLARWKRKMIKIRSNAVPVISLFKIEALAILCRQNLSILLN